MGELIGSDGLAVQCCHAHAQLQPASAEPAMCFYWVTVRKPKELVFASVSVIAVAKKETVRTPKDPDRSLGFGTREHG